MEKKKSKTAKPKAKSIKKSDKPERKFFTFREYNDWEGETWNFCFPKEGNEEAISLLEKFIEMDGTYGAYSFGPEIKESELDVLVKRGESGYLHFWNKIDAVMDIDKIKKAIGEVDDEDPFYKGGIINMKKRRKNGT